MACQGSDEVTDLFEEMTVSEQQYDQNLWSWKTFLAPLNPFDTESNVVHVDPPYSPGPLVERFKLLLEEQHVAKEDERKQAVANAKDGIESIIPGLSSMNVFEKLRRSFQNYEKASKIKSDVECSGSTWTVEMLERYISRDNIKFITPIQCVHEADETVINEIFKNVPIQRDLRTECDTRMVLDAILLPLCAHKGLTLRTEQTIKCSKAKLPPNRFDYIIRSREGLPIGAVEAKQRGSLGGKSMAQLIVQLLLLSAKNPNLFCFGILSDGCQFVFVGLRAEKVLFFQTNQIHLEIATIKDEQDLKGIIQRISWFISFTITSNNLLLL